MSYSYFANQYFSVQHESNLHAMDPLLSYEYDYLFEINTKAYSLNSLFNTRFFKQTTNVQNSSDEEKVDINLTINRITLDNLLISDTSTSQGQISGYKGIDTGILSDEKKISLRLLEIIAIKIFGHAKARAAIANDKQFYDNDSISGSVIHQIITGLDSSIKNRKFDIFNQYVHDDRIQLNVDNDVDQNVNFNFSGSDIYIPMYFTTSLDQVSNTMGLQNGPGTVGGSLFKNGTVTVPILVQFKSLPPFVYTFTELASGVNGTTYSLMSFGGDLYAGGNFNDVGSYISKWDGTSWTTLDSGTNGTILSMVVYNNELYIAGSFTDVGSYIAKWNGTSWVPVGEGVDNVIYSMTVYNGELYVSGDFLKLADDSLVLNNIAKWNGTSWSTVGDGLTGPAYTLTDWNGNLYAGGKYIYDGSCIAVWNGTTWDNVGSGINDIVNTLVVYDNMLYAGGYFTDVGNSIARWNGTSWLSVGSGTNGDVYTMVVFNDDLYVGGDFTSPGNYIAKWNTINWLPVSTSFNDIIFSLTVYNSNIYAGGLFTQPGNGIIKINMS
jgi:hypothetical protein